MLKVGVGPSASRKFRAHADSSPSGSPYCGVMNWTRSGTCRDYALFMIEALRRLGIAARFVSGYLFIHGDRAHGYVGGGSTHAWVQVYLPSAGWIEFDPTNGIVGTHDLVRVAMARDPRQAIPLHGTYLGSADAFVGMDVSINVVSAEASAEA